MSGRFRARSGRRSRSERCRGRGNAADRGLGGLVVVADDLDRAETAASRLVAIAAASPTSTIGGPLEVDVRPGRGAARRRGHRLDPLAVPVQLVVGQAVDDDARPARRRPRPASRTAAGRRRSGSRARPRARRRSTGSSRIRSSSASMSSDRRDRDLGVDRGARRERPGPAAQVEAGACAVGVALLLAQLHVQARVEEPAQDRAHHRHGVEVRDPARHARVADADLGLDGARPMDDADDPPGDARRLGDDRPGASAPGGRPQSPNSRSAIARDVDARRGRRRRSASPAPGSRPRS